MSRPPGLAAWCRGQMSIPRTNGRRSTSNLGCSGSNGVDAPWDYDGTTWTATAWTGPTKANLIQAAVYNTRLFAVEVNTCKFWYAAANAVTGAMTAFDLANVARSGGTPASPWNMDLGRRRVGRQTCAGHVHRRDFDLSGHRSGRHNNLCQSGIVRDRAASRQAVSHQVGRRF